MDAPPGDLLMGTAIGAAIDYLVTGLTEVMATVDGRLRVADNWPDTLGDGYLVIGHTSSQDGGAADADNVWYDLGALRIEESFSIPCYIEITRPGPSQKLARDAAITVFDATVDFIRSDLSLGGALNRGRVAIASHLHLTQTADAEDTGEHGALRRAVLAFQIDCKNTYL